MATESTHRYAILTETNGGEYETWYTFIRYEGNEEAIKHLDEQFKKIRFYIIDELSTFEIEYKRLVCEQTAREMCKMDLNSYMFHRKFDGKLSLIDFGFSKHDRNDDKIEKINDKIGMGDIDRYIDMEDPCDSDFESVSDSQSVRSYESDSDHSDHSDHSDNDSDRDRYYRNDRNDRNDRRNDDRNYRYSYSSDSDQKDSPPSRYKNDKGSKSSNDLKNDKGSKNSNESKNESKNDHKNESKTDKGSKNTNDLKNDQKSSKNSNDLKDSKESTKVNKDSKAKDDKKGTR